MRYAHIHEKTLNLRFVLELCDVSKYFSVCLRAYVIRLPNEFDLVIILDHATYVHRWPKVCRIDARLKVLATWE
jgi:hypothetical protein